MLHWLPAQTAVACGLVGQTLAQPPQLLASVLVSTQAPLHSMYGETQAKPQVLAAQVGVALTGGMHTLSQLPQCEVLLVRSTHEPSQLVVVPGQAPLAHLPAVHTSDPLHATAQSPQCAPSEVKSTQLPLQLV